MMKPMNYEEVRKTTVYFLLYLLVLIAFTCLPAYCFFLGLDFQRRNIVEQLWRYKEVQNKQFVLERKVDSLFYQMSLLNTDRVGNSLFLEKYIADNSLSVRRTIGTDSTNFSVYQSLMVHFNDMLMIKDSIRQVSVLEDVARKDLLDCIRQTKTINTDLAYDPLRHFESNK